MKKTKYKQVTSNSVIPIKGMVPADILKPLEITMAFYSGIVPLEVTVVPTSLRDHISQLSPPLRDLLQNIDIPTQHDVNFRQELMQGNIICARDGSVVRSKGTYRYIITTNNTTLEINDVMYLGYKDTTGFG